MQNNNENLKKYRKRYDEILDVRINEIELKEEQKTLKTQTFINIEKELSILCEKERKKLKMLY